MTMNGDAQETILGHLGTLFASERASLDTSRTDDNGNPAPEVLVMSANENGKITFFTNKDSLSVTSLENTWTSHASGCSDCTGWSL
jgi:hypothetical protein